MLYQLSYASPAQTSKNYHTGNEIARGLKSPPEAAPHTDARSDRASNFGLLRGWLRKISVIQLRVMMIPRHGNYYQRALIRLADCVRQLDSIDLPIILVVLLKLA